MNPETQFSNFREALTGVKQTALFKQLESGFNRLPTPEKTKVDRLFGQIKATPENQLNAFRGVVADRMAPSAATALVLSYLDGTNPRGQNRG